MKTLLSIFLLTLSSLSFGAPCGGALVVAHKNPDGSTGGMVAKTATVASTVNVNPGATVCDKAKVQGNVRVGKGSEISGSAILEGGAVIKSSKIKGNAKVYGNAVVTNSTVCQASLINFNVSNSEYYCDLEDESPKDPGENGLKTILGIDSNVNGIRDDVEVWINNKTTNTQNNDLYNVRMSLRQIAKSLQSAIKSKDIKNEAQRYMLDSISGKRCLEEITNDKKILELADDLNIEIFNTEPRFFAYARAHGTLNGLSLNNNSKVNCDFKKR